MSDLLQEFESFGKNPTGHSDNFGLDVPSSSIPSNPFDDNVLPSAASVKPTDQFIAKRRSTEFPILRHFDTSRIRLPQGHITHLTVSNNVATFCCLGNSVYRYNLSTETPAESCEIKREDDARIQRVYQDPKAQHLLVCMSSKETYYVSRGGGSKKPQPRLLSKLKGHLIESIAWNMEEQTDHTTGAILFGTSEGIICETIIDAQEKRRSYCIEVHELMQDMKGHVEPITGMHMQPFPSNFGGSSGKYFVLVTTPCRIYQFIGYATKGEVQFQEMFSAYKDYVKIQFQEIPGVLKDSKLCLWPQKQNRFPTSFAWLTGAGIYYCSLAFGSQEAGESLFLAKNLIPYSAACDSGDDKDAKVEWNQKDSALPIGLTLTEFHCILLFRDKIVAICHLNNKKVFEEPFNMRRHGPLSGLCCDPVTGNLWIWAKMFLQAYHPHREGRNVWKIYLDQEQFLLARKYAEGNQASMDLILVRQAEHHFKEGQYEAAAEDFSKSRLSFEEVALKFLQVNKKEALKKFLHLKLDSLNTETDKTQCTMLTIWLIEMYLNELGVYKDSNNTDQYLKLQEEFHDSFLQKKSIKDSLYHNSGTIYDLMLSHGATEDVIFFAKLMEDYERVIEHHIQQYQYEEALKTLSARSQQAMSGPEKNRRAKFQKLSGLYYKFSPVLVKHIPRETVEAWISCERYLNPKKLIPALIQCNQTGGRNQATPEEQNAAAIMYLQFCVSRLRSEEPSVHNFLVSSYANSKDPEDHQRLKKYLIQQNQDGIRPNYDVQYALRMCLEKHLDEACVYIYSAMGLYEECVSLALECGDVTLARRMVVGNPLLRKDDLLQKKLWLKIAEYLIKKEKDISKAMQFLKECDILKIEDILPFFEDVVTIDQFKDAICDSLQSYNTHIDHLKREMDTATTSAKNIRSDIQEIRNKCVVIRSNQKCIVCEGRLLAQAFYMFPCHHSFHHDCLVGEMDKIQKARQRLIRRFEIRQYKPEDVGSDCPFCGNSMIASVSIPLLPMGSLHTEMMKWT